MPRRAHVYPQVDPGAVSLVSAAPVRLDAQATVTAALALARRRDATVMVATGRRVILREDLARARALGLGELPARVLARPVPAVDARASEIVVRRHFIDGAPAALVRDGTTLVGIATPSAAAAAAARPSMRHRLAQWPDAVWSVLHEVRRLATSAPASAWLVGGAVRDCLRDVPVALRDVPVTLPDLDIAVEGDAPALAEALAGALGGSLVVHARFLTASVETSTVGTIDVITARSERYEVPGALPRVMPAGIERDLRRRDFTVNAMAIDLMANDHALLDPLGGRADLAAGRLRVLHPLSFVEDPTRMFRAARYAARLGFDIDPWTRECRRLAIALAPYPALSGARLLAELDAIARDERPDVALTDLGDSQVYRLLDRRYRFTEQTRAWVAALPAAPAWVRAGDMDLRPVELIVVTLLGDQRPEVVAAALDRLGYAGEPRKRILGTTTGHTAMLGALRAARTPSRRAHVLRELSPVALGWMWLAGDAETRAAVEWWRSTGRALRPALRGDDVVALGVPPGPEVAAALRALRDARLDAALEDRDAEAEWVRRWVVTRKEG
ncbi:MAG: CCA tRNA nucleotidyltransferase [Candidatus Rokubacteria bacterium]|nr:CCA tRNA nucleotidyltransferase [Candidatus Rokubacteria bacterium]